MFEGLFGHLFGAIGSFIELHPLVAAAFYPFFNPHEDKGPDGLRAGITTPDPAKQGGDKEQAESTDDQNPGQEHKVLREKGSTKQVELPVGEVEVHQLLSINADPAEGEIHAHQEPEGCGAKALKYPFDFFDINLRAGGIEIDCLRLFTFGVDLVNRNLLSHAINLSIKLAIT